MLRKYMIIIFLSSLNITPSKSYHHILMAFKISKSNTDEFKKNMCGCENETSYPSGLLSGLLPQKGAGGASLTDVVTQKASKRNEKKKEGDEINEINESNLQDHLYPDTGETPFSDLEPSSEPDKNNLSETEQTGGGNMFVGKSRNEIIYNKNKMYYKVLK